MSLDVTLTKMMPTDVYGSNITHNLSRMAGEVKLWNLPKYTLYDVLWHPEEHGLLYAKDIVDLLDEAYNTLLASPDYFKKFNPENGWGNYDTLCVFVYKYRDACRGNPDAEIEVSR